jgi:hypothetical protein
VQIKPVIFALLRCTSIELFFFCCGCVAAPRATALAARSKYLRRTTSGVTGNGQVPVTQSEWRRRQRPGHQAQVPREPKRTCAAPRASTWAPRPSTCGAQRAAPWGAVLAPQSSTCDSQRVTPHGLSRYRGLLMYPSTTSAPHSPCFVRVSFANK